MKRIICGLLAALLLGSLMAGGKLRATSPFEAAAFADFHLYLPTILQHSALPEPRELALVGNLGGTASAIDVIDQTMYVAVGREMLIFDVTDEQAPRLIGRTGWLGDFIADIDVRGPYAYVACGPTGIRILDVTDPTTPRQVAIYDTPGEASSLYFVDNLAYLADMLGGLRILDVSAPTHPVELGSYTGLRDAADVVVVDGLAYLADNDTGLWIVTVANPQAPKLVTHVWEQDDANGIAVAGHYVYLVDGDWDLGIYDVRDPEKPEAVGFISVGGASDVDVVGLYAYVSGRSFQVIDVSTPSQPKRVGRYDTGSLSTKIIGARAYLATSVPGPTILDLTDPTTPTLVGSRAFPNRTFEVWADGSMAYVNDGDTGLHLVDVTQPARPVEVANYPQWHANDMRIVGGLAYLTDGEGLRILDVTDARNVHEVGFYNAPVYSRGVWVEAHYAYVADERAGLRIVDVGDPTAPREVGAFALPNPETRSFNAVKVVGSYAYLTGNGFWVIDVSDPTAPRQAGSYGVYSDVIDVQGNRAYLQAGNAGLRILDVSNPAAPTLLTTYAMLGVTEGIQVVGRYAYLANYSAGLRVVDVADPNRLREVAYHDTPSPGDVWGVDVHDGLVYLAAETNGLLVVEDVGP